MKKTPYGEIDRQASSTNVHPQPASRGTQANMDIGMSDIDDHSSPSGSSSPHNPDHASGFIPHSHYGSETPKSMGQDVTTSHGSHAGFGDQTAQHVKMSHEKLHHVRNTALEEAETQHDNAGKQVPYQHGDPEY